MSDDTLLGLLGVYDNLNEPEPNANRRETILGVTISFIILSWICGSFRLYTRFFIIYSPGWDDLVLAFAMLTSLASACATCKLSDTGLGQHFIYFTPDRMSSYLQGFYVANATYTMSTALIKISLLLQYRRVFENQKMRLVCTVLIVAISLWGGAYTVLSWVPCYPVYTFWDILYTGNKVCYAYGASTAAAFTMTFESHSGSNMIFDLLVLSLPVYLCFKSDTDTRTRIGLVGLLTGGCIVVFISAWRFATLLEHQSATYPTLDPTWYSPISILLSAVEVDIASVCASVPVFWPVLTHSLGGIFVTKEIEITREDRRDEFELHRTRSGRSESAGAFDQESTHSTDWIDPESRGRKLIENFRMQGGDPFESDKTTRVEVKTLVRSDSRSTDAWKI